MNKIIFSFDGKKYQVDGSAYDADHIKLPDGKILKVNQWQESSPPKPIHVTLVTEGMPENTPVAEEIA